MDCGFDCQAFDRYRVDLPYPSVPVSRPNRRYAKLLSGAYAGCGSELTAVTQYAFHRLFAGEYPQVYEALGYIAAVEVTHLTLLGDLIRRLGSVPVYADLGSGGGFWRGSCPDCSTAIVKMLAADIAGERDAIAHYEMLICRIGDESINDLLRRIILDEQKHIEILTPFYERYRLGLSE